jgi:hypothetical protein
MLRFDSVGLVAVPRCCTAAGNPKPRWGLHLAGLHLAGLRPTSPCMVRLPGCGGYSQRRGLTSVRTGSLVQHRGRSLTGVQPALKFAIEIAVLVLFVVTAIALVWVNARPGRRPRRLVLADGAFTVPANRRVRLLQIANLAVYVLWAGVIIAPNIHDVPDMFQTAVFVGLSFPLVVILGLEVFLVWAYRRPPITLTPAGVRLKLRTFSWDRLNVSMPWSIPTSPLATNKSFPELDADPAFIAAAIDYYCRNPGARAAIGQTDEHDRLQAALGVAS